jgi:hypothetical protein
MVVAQYRDPLRKAELLPEHFAMFWSKFDGVGLSGSVLTRDLQLLPWLCTFMVH